MRLGCKIKYSPTAVIAGWRRWSVEDADIQVEETTRDDYGKENGDSGDS